MRILHTSDWHLGMMAGTRSLEEDQRYFFQQLYELIEKESVDAVICAGDIYDSSIANADAIALYNEVTAMICGKLKKDMIVIAGNHDGAARLSVCHELLKEAGLHVSGRLTHTVEPIVLGNAAIYPVPFFNKEEVGALYPEHKKELQSQEKAMQFVCDKIRENMDPSKYQILVSHSLIVNAELSESDRSARVGYATAVSKDVFEEFDYVALGHIHKPQALTEQIRYSGSPVKYSFGAEEKQVKTVILIDTETKEICPIELKELRGRRTVTGELEEILEMEEIANDYLRLKVTDRYAGLELLAQLRQRFPYLLELYGKNMDEQGEAGMLTPEELQTLDEMDIMKKFFMENFGYEPNQEQIDLFQDVLEWSEKEEQ